MSKQSQFGCDTAFPRLASLIRAAGADRYITHGELVEKMMDDDLVKEHAGDPSETWKIANKMVGMFSKCFTTGEMAHLMEGYKQEFTRKRIREVWAYRLAGK